VAYANEFAEFDRTKGDQARGGVRQKITHPIRLRSNNHHCDGPA